MDIRALDLNLLPVLDSLLRQRGVSAAARELGMSQPATSDALRRLRETLGDPLLVRAGGGMLPTPRAQALVRPLAEILDRIRSDVTSARGFTPGESRRRFALCLSDVGSYVLWPRIVQAVRARAPGVTVDLRPLGQAAIAPALESGEVDLAVGAYPALPAGLFQQRLFARRYVCFMRAGHPLAGRRPGVSRFAAAEHLVVPAPSRIQERVDQQLARLGLARRVKLVVPSYLMVPALVDAADFVAVIPGQLADAFRRHGLFATSPLPVTVPAVAIRQHWHRRFHADDGNRWLRGLVAELFGETGRSRNN